MRRWIAILWHASFLVLAGGLYFFFVLPRWYELLGDWSPTLGTAMRILCGLLIGLAAVPVLLTWRRARRPEYGTPQLALTLRIAAVALQVTAAVLIVATAISEIWLSLDSVGRWLFAVYGAAAAAALLGALSFYLAFAAELPPPPPKPLKPKGQTRRRGRGKSDAEAVPAPASDANVSSDVTETVDAGEIPEASEAHEPSEAVEVEESAVGNAEALDDDKIVEENDSEENGKLRNRRPAGKSSSRLFRRSRGGVALGD